MAHSIYLVGFMAVGKTTVGRALATHLGVAFVDLDEVIASSKQTPVAAMVADDEVAFRRAEATALADISARAAGGNMVIATGGGCAAWGDNMSRMRATGIVVTLTASMPEVRRRAKAGPPRPLLGDDAAAAALLRKRQPAYLRAHATVPTDGVSIADVVANVTSVATAVGGTPLESLAAVVALGERTYAVTIDDARPNARALHPAVTDATKLGVLVDANVASNWRSELHAAFASRPHIWVEVPSGESSKAVAVYERMCEQLVGGGLDRSSAIVAVGGGVVGDLAGFVAATLFRGIPVVHWPTTLVAMTDSAIGGKTGLDLAAGKNLIGAFWQPRAVTAHLPFLATLPARERRAGFGELWKYALLAGSDLWAAVEAHCGWAAADEPSAVPTTLAECVAAAAAVKAHVVSQDELEQKGLRVLLNLGHTVGHAIETETQMLHGEAVALGLVTACLVSEALGVGAQGLGQALSSRLAATGLLDDPRPYLTESTLARIGVDKKRRGTRVSFVAVADVGQCTPIEVELDELRGILRSLPTL